MSSPRSPLLTPHSLTTPQRVTTASCCRLLWLSLLAITAAEALAIELWDGNSSSDPESPHVCLAHGGCLRGRHMPGYQTERFEAFLGIPYALPPLGELRFSNPKVHPKWAGTRNATTPRADCIQKNYLLAHPEVQGEEDCLYLNVYRPERRGRKQLPVMVYIHGGGWFSGSAGPALHGPEYFMDTKEVIVVTLAYRLGAFGFLSTNDAHMPGNFGLKDQNLALRWVKRHIASFDGNPKQVTLFGQSAGAISAHMHALSPLSAGLFRGLVALSGTANVPFAINRDPLAQTRRLAELCNVTQAGVLSTAKLARLLRDIDARTLIEAGDGLKYWHVDPMTNFRPVVEPPDAGDAFLTQHPERILESGNYLAVPWMVGGVPQEGAVRVVSILEDEGLRADFNRQFTWLFEKLMAWPERFDQRRVAANSRRLLDEYFGGERELNNATWRGFLDIITDRGFHRPLINAVLAYVATVDTEVAPVFLHSFNYRGRHSFASFYSDGRPLSHDYGVVHCDDLIYLFRSPVLFPDFPRNSTEARVVEAFVGNLVHFAKHLEPRNRHLLRPCNRASIRGGEPDAICDYQEFVNGDAPDSFEVKASNRVSFRRVQLWDELLDWQDRDCSRDGKRRRSS